MKFERDASSPFWKKFRLFFQYLKQEKLYYQITLLAFANVLLLIPSLIITILVSALLFLASYKLAFEVLHTVSSGQFVYADTRSFEIDDKIGFKAIVMGIIQILIFLFIYRYDPPVGLALLIMTTVATPAYLMMLSKTQDIFTSLNPLNLMSVMGRIGIEYYVLLVFFLACAGLNFAFRYYVAGAMPGIIGDVITAWVLYFLLVFTFLVIGYVMYRHADELGHDTVDTEFFEFQSPNKEDPIKERIKSLINENNGQEAINIIHELKAEDNRTDLDVFLSQAESLLIQDNRLRPADKLEKLIAEKQYKRAIDMVFEYLDDGHFLKTKEACSFTQLIVYAFENNQFKEVLQLTRNFDQRYPLDHEYIVSNYFLVAKINYQSNKSEQAEKLLASLIEKYSHTVNTNQISSYLKGIQKFKGE